MAFDAASTAAINGLAGSSSVLDGMAILLSRGGVEVIVFLIALRWWAKQDRPAAR